MTKDVLQRRGFEEVPCTGINRNSLGLNPEIDLTANANRVKESRSGMDCLLLQLSAVLQTTLELEPLLRCFSWEVGTIIPHSGINYVNKDEEVELTAGRKAKYSYTFHLLLEERGLGLLTFSRGPPFSDNEIANLKRLLCALVYPLRNALTYRKAVLASTTDPLTGIFNRTIMETSLRREIALSKRHKIPLSLLILDIDRFKAINDEYGHGVGDTVLVAVTDSISRCLRKTDILSRYGGDEFVILLSNTNKKGAKILVRHIIKGLKGIDYLITDTNLKVTLSIGIATLARGENIKRLFKRADQALYKAKEEGRNRAKVAP